VSTRTDVKQFPIRGEVISSDEQAGTVTLKTEASGYTSAVAMPYTLEPPGIAKKLHAGETITAMLAASPTADVLRDVKVVAPAGAKR
jgi:hypothetical protein